MRDFGHTKENDASNGGWVTHKGSSDMWELVCKASNKDLGIMKSTKRMRVARGYLYQVTTETPQGIAEALCFVPHPLGRV